MTIAKTLAAVQRSKQYAAVLETGLTLSSTDRQLSNGTLVFTGKLKVGRKTIRPKFAVTANGAVISNEFTARRVSDAKPTVQYRRGLDAVTEILSKRLTT